jgi:hypothetical protein
MALRKVTCPHCNEEIPGKVLMKPRLGQSVRCPHCSNLFMNSWTTELLGGLFTGLAIAVLIGLALSDIIPSVLSLVAGIAIVVLYVTVLYPLIFSARPYNPKARYKQIIVLLISVVLFSSMILYSVFGALPLIVAAKTGNTFVVKLLISLGADPNMKNDGITKKFGIEYPLEGAILSGRTDVTEYLIKHGADINAVNSLGSKPIHLAVSQNNKEMVALLLARGANPNDKYRFFKATPLMIASEKGFTAIAELLIDSGAGIEARGELMWDLTPLMLAAQNCHADLVQLLMSRGANVWTINEKGTTARSLAAECENKEILKILSGKKTKSRK